MHCAIIYNPLSPNQSSLNIELLYWFLQTLPIYEWTGFHLHIAAFPGLTSNAMIWVLVSMSVLMWTSVLEGSEVRAPYRVTRSIDEGAINSEENQPYQISSKLFDSELLDCKLFDCIFFLNCNRWPSNGKVELYLNYRHRYQWIIFFLYCVLWSDQKKWKYVTSLQL